MRLIYCKNNMNNHTGKVTYLYHDDASNVYYRILYPRTGDIYYINIHECEIKDGILYHEIIGKDDVDKLFIYYCRQHAGCRGCKYENENKCKECFIRDHKKGLTII